MTTYSDSLIEFRGLSRLMWASEQPVVWDWRAAARSLIGMFLTEPQAADVRCDARTEPAPVFLDGAIRNWRAMPATTFSVRIGEAEVASYARNGFLAIDRITTDEELEWLREVYDALIAMPVTGLPDGLFDLSRPYGTTDAPALGQILRPERFVPRIRQTAMWRNARQIAAQLLSIQEETVHSWGHLIFKGPNSMVETPWHQDEAYSSARKDYAALSSWFALDNVDESNGCLWFLPGSQREEVHRHRHAGNDPRIHALQIDEAMDFSTAEPVPLSAGGITFHHARVCHYAGTNTTDRVRRAWTNQFLTEPTRRETPKSFPWRTAGRKALAEVMAAREGNVR